METNLKSVFLLSQLFGAPMLKHSKGKIINVASMLFLQGWDDRGLRGEQGRRGAVDEIACQRMGGAGRERERHCARLHPYQRYVGAHQK